MKNWLSHMLLFCSAVTLFGCASLSQHQKRGVLNFGDGCSSLGAIVSNELTSMRNDAIKMNTYNYILAGSPQLAKREGPFTIVAVTARIKAAQVLENYGNLLVTLVKASEAEEIDTAFRSLATSLESLDKENKVIDLKNMTLLGKAIGQVFGIWIDHKKATIVKDVVPRMAPQVEKLCDLLNADFDKDGNRLVTGYLTISSILLVSVNDKLQEDKLTDDAKEKYAQIFVLADTGQKRIEATSAKVHETIDQVKVAQEHLLGLFNAEITSVDEIYDFAVKVKNLGSTIRVWTKPPAGE